MNAPPVVRLNKALKGVYHDTFLANCVGSVGRKYRLVDLSFMKHTRKQQ